MKEDLPSGQDYLHIYIWEG